MIHHVVLRQGENNYPDDVLTPSSLLSKKNSANRVNQKGTFDEEVAYWQVNDSRMLP